jgi:hypothetical protein
MRAHLLVPDWQVGVRGLPLLIDTGSDSSSLSAYDAARLNLDFSRLVRAEPLAGVGGLAERTVTPANLLFYGEDAAYVYRVQLDVLVPQRDLIELPSILGRDVLDRWRMVYDPTEAELSFTVRSADLSAPLP